jgi:hypothetical protein
VPNGLEIEARERVLDDARRQIAEFDVVIRGNVGSTDFTWLIECRQKPIRALFGQQHDPECQV